MSLIQKKGFRSHFSNNTSLIKRMLSKFQSENITMINNIITDIFVISNTDSKKHKKDLQRRLTALVVNSFYITLISKIVSALAGYRPDEEDEMFDYIVNGVIWEGIIGTIPYVNQFFTSD